LVPIFARRGAVKRSSASSQAVKLTGVAATIGATPVNAKDLSKLRAYLAGMPPELRVFCSAISVPLAGEVLTTDLVIGYSNPNSAQLLRCIERMDEPIGRVARRAQAAPQAASISPCSR
jgi:hypothetical protein